MGGAVRKRAMGAVTAICAAGLAGRGGGGSHVARGEPALGIRGRVCGHGDGVERRRGGGVAASRRRQWSCGSPHALRSGASRPPSTSRRPAKPLSPGGRGRRGGRDRRLDASLGSDYLMEAATVTDGIPSAPLTALRGGEGSPVPGGRHERTGGHHRGLDHARRFHRDRPGVVPPGRGELRRPGEHLSGR